MTQYRTRGKTPPDEHWRRRRALSATARAVVLGIALLLRWLSGDLLLRWLTGESPWPLG